MANVPFVDLSRIHKDLKKDILDRIGSIIDRSAFVLGPEVEAFEKSFAEYCGTKYCVGVSNGLDAIQVALQAAGVGPGDEVITAANTFIATAYAISATGAKVVLVDADEESWNLSPKLLEAAITSKTKAIVPVHLYGQPATMKPILDVAQARKIHVIEDAAQAHGARFGGQSTGSFGTAGCFSFYPGKNLGSMGEGGALTTNSEEIRDRAKMIRNVGQKEKYKHEVIGRNFRLQTIQAAILSAKLPHLNAQNEDRVKAAKKYDELLSGIPGIRVQKVAPNRTHVYHLYIVVLEDPTQRAPLQKFLGDQGIQSGIHYPIPIHLSTCYQSLGLRRGSFPVTEKLADSVLSLPMFPGISDQEIQAVAKALGDFFKR